MTVQVPGRSTHNVAGTREVQRNRRLMRPIFIYVGSAIVAILLAMVAVIAFGPEGTPVAATRATLTPGNPCDGLSGKAREECLTGSSDAAASIPGARDARASSNSGRNARGAGIEGVTSGGTVAAAPGR